MDTSCANHPESMALATCKACEKSVCLMCVVDEKEGTFCSADCHSAFASGRQVPKFAGAATNAAASGSGMQKIDSIFDDEPAAPSAPAEQTSAPPSDDPMPIVAEGTKWRPTGSQCDAHRDTPAVANCDRCGKPVCALCLLEAPQGTFCSSECMGNVSKQSASVPAPAERAALQGKPVFKFKEPPKSNKGVMVAVIVVLLAAAAAGVYYGWNAFSPEIVAKPPEKIAEVPAKPELPPPVVPPTPPDPVKPEVTVPVRPPDPTPDPPRPNVAPPSYVYVKPKPYIRPVVYPTRSLNPWADQEPGAWYRVKIVQAGKVMQTDTGLKEKGQDFVVLVQQTYSDGQASGISETKIPFPTVYLRGEETFTFDGQSFLCEIRTSSLEDSASKTWALLSGRAMGATIKSTTSSGGFTARTVWEGTWRVDGRPLDCVVVEGQLKDGTATRDVKTWYCGAVPLRVVREESGDNSLALVHMGFDWSRRPGFDR